MEEIGVYSESGIESDSLVGKGSPLEKLPCQKRLSRHPANREGERERKKRKGSPFMEKRLRLPVRPGVVVQLSAESHARQLSDWQHSLVGKFIDDFPPPPLATDAAVASLWHLPSDTIRTIPFPNDRYIFKLDNPDDKKRIIAGGPYTVNGKLLALQPLPPFTTVDYVQFNRVPVWITLTGLPVDLHCQDVVLAVAEPAGHPIEVDVALGSASSGACRVRVRVEIEVEEPLLQGAYLDDGKEFLLWIGFVYEGIPRICRNCMCVGHIEGDCKKTSMQAKFTVTKRLEGIARKINAPIVNDPSAEALFGSSLSRSPAGKFFASAGAIICADVRSGKEKSSGHARVGRKKAAAVAVMSKEEGDEEVSVIPLSVPTADHDFLNSSGPISYWSGSTMEAGLEQRGVVGKRKYKAEKVKK
ncbi:hypothetical protein SAY86_030483 [Trapa natans]|uniref:DUF4283 domain-containing protein n=1 Tax=Trapa natans TaxID=22666 RepID=A0AAN7MG45_TRANT|nr:hypothetical protein SAY86_030483 [Trapa natans]